MGAGGRMRRQSHRGWSSHEVAIGLGMDRMVAELLPGYAGSGAVWYANTFERLPTSGTTHFGQQVEYRPGNFF